MALHPYVYAKMLGEKIAKHNVHCWLVNTGWTGGSYGVGKRIEIAHTRSMIHAILSGELETVATTTHPIFGFHVPETVRDVPPELLNPRNTWKNPEAYDEKARDLATQFIENFKEYSDNVSKTVLAAGPKIETGKRPALQKLKG